MANRKEAAKHRSRGENGKFVKRTNPVVKQSLDPFAPDNLPLAVVPHANINHAFTFAGLAGNLVGRMYSGRADEAMRASLSNARAMRRDSELMRALHARQLNTALLPGSVEAPDSDDPFLTMAGDHLQKIIEAIPRFTELKRSATEALWYGKSGIAIKYDWDYSRGWKDLVVKDWVPVNGDKLYFSYDNDDVGYLVGLQNLFSTDGQINGTYQPSDRGRVRILDPTEREALIIHKHFVLDGDFEDPQQAGLVHGAGIRHFVYWTWFYKFQLLDWLVMAMERWSAGGFIIYYYDEANAQSLREMKTMAESMAPGKNIFLIPRRSGNEGGGPGLEIIQPNVANMEFFKSVIADYFDAQLYKFILGQELSSTSKATGIGSGNADFQQETLSSITQYDARNLEETLTNQLLRVIQRYTFPTLADVNFRYRLAIDKPNVDKELKAIKAYYDMGGTVGDDYVRSLIGVPRPKNGEAILGGSIPSANGGNLASSAETVH